MTEQVAVGLEQPHIVIVGSGFAGFHCAWRLSASLRRHRARARITMISPIDYLLYTPLLPEVAGGVIDPRLVAIPLADTLPRVRLVRGYVDAVDIAARTLAFRDQEATTRQLGWDRLVLTPGSITRLHDIPGLADNARGLKSIAQALYLRDHILEQFELARADTDPDRAAARRTVVVVGSSYSGTELIGQLCAMAQTAARRFGFAPEDLRLILVERSGRMMPEIGPTLAARAERQLRGRGVQIRTGVTLTNVAPDHVDLSDGTRIGTCTVAWVAGVSASPLIHTLGLDTLHGRLRVEPDLHVPNTTGVFAAGDAAAVPDLTTSGDITAPTAQHAIRQGAVLADNVMATLTGAAARPYRHRNLGTVVDLGPGFAVANPLNVQLSGHLAKAVTRGYHLYAIPRAGNRWAVGMAYLADLMFSRQLVSLGLAPSSIARFAASETFEFADNQSARCNPTTNRPPNERTKTMTTQQQSDSADNWPLPAEPKVLVFDVNETLIDFESMTPLFERVLGDGRAMREWLGHLIMYSMTATLSGLYVDYFTLGPGLLKMVGDIHGVTISEKDAALIKEGMLTMPAHPDVKKGLTLLRDKGFRLVTLTNSPPTPGGPTPLEHAGLKEFFEDHQYSIEACRVYKPAAAVYHYVAQEEGVPPSSCMMVAAHVWDTVGAQAAGYSSALITRPGNAPLHVPGLPQPNVIVADLEALGHELIGPGVNA
jgi:NADH:ubiquinone reductase (H+-translocating)